MKKTYLVVITNKETGQEEFRSSIECGRYALIREVADVMNDLDRSAVVPKEEPECDCRQYTNLGSCEHTQGY
jgi:hypothetical protein